MGTVTDRTTLIDVGTGSFAGTVAHRPAKVAHRLAGHPLLDLEAIAELADALPIRAVERHRADLPLVLPGGAPELEGRPSDTVRGIETNGAWLVLWNIEQDPRYRELLDACLDGVEPLVRPEHGPLVRRMAFLFLSAPGAVTPAHFDPEHNFLLQIRGTKEMNVGRFPDRAAELRELDRYHDGGHRNIELVPADVTTFEMAPGDGVYVPPWAPHWVRNGPAVSMSLSITFRTRASARDERVHRANAKLRKVRLRPRPAGASTVADQAKAAVITTVDEARRLRGRRSPIAR